MHIKQFADKFNIQPDTIRYYEREGVLEPKRQENGYRTYDEVCIQQLQFVLVLKQLGFTIKEIRQLLLLKGEPVSEECNQTTVALFQNKITKLEQKIKFYQVAIECLNTAKGLMNNGKYVENESIVEELIFKMFMQIQEEAVYDG